MLSRTADHLYWMARFIERAENMARVLDVTYNMSLIPNAAESEARTVAARTRNFRQRKSL